MPARICLEIETDKATVTHPAEASGTVEILAPVGTTLPVGAPIARIGQAGEAPAAPPVGRAPVAAGNGMPAATSGVAMTPQAAAPVSDAGARTNGRIKATPVARRVALAHGVVAGGRHRVGPARAGSPAATCSRKLGIAAPRRRRRPQPQAAATQCRAATAASACLGREGRCRARLDQPRAVADRASHGRGEGDRAALPGPDRRRDGRSDGVARTAQGGRPRRRRRPIGQRPDRQGRPRSLCAAIHVRTPSFRDGAFELHQSRQRGRRRRGRRRAPSSPPSSTPTVSRSARSPRVTRELAGRVRSGQIAADRARRRHLHRLQPRHVRDDRHHPGDQSAPGRPSSASAPSRDHARSDRRRDRGPRADDPHPVLRPPHPLRGRRRAPARGHPGPARAAAEDRPVTTLGISEVRAPPPRTSACSGPSPPRSTA